MDTRVLLVEGWRNKFHQTWVDSYQDEFFEDIVTLSHILPYSFFVFFYSNLRPLSTDYSMLVTKYTNVIEQFRLDESMAAHVKNLEKVVDDLMLNIELNAFNADSNLTLTQVRAIARHSYIR